MLSLTCELVAPTLVEGNVRDEELASKSWVAGSPVPNKLTFCGLPTAEEVICRLAERDPIALGVNARYTVQPPPGVSEVPQLLLAMPKSLALVPVMVNPEIVIAAVPSL